MERGSGKSVGSLEGFEVKFKPWATHSEVIANPAPDGPWSRALSSSLTWMVPRCLCSIGILQPGLISSLVHAFCPWTVILEPRVCLCCCPWLLSVSPFQMSLPCLALAHSHSWSCSPLCLFLLFPFRGAWKEKRKF